MIQPGLVYVIEWAAGGDVVAPATDHASTDEDSKLNDREMRRLRRDQKRTEKQKHEDEIYHNDPADPASGAVYVAYVFSAFRLPILLTSIPVITTGSTFHQ